MKYQIDQSGKIEQTDKNTVLGAVNGQTYAIILQAKDKRRLQEIFRRLGTPQIFIDTVFATCLYLLIKQLPKTNKAKVDIEYPGHTKIIDNFIKRLSNDKIIVEWIRVGKSSKAHDIAYKVYRGKLKIGKRLTTETVWKEAKKIAGGYLKTGLSPANRHSAPANRHNIAKKKGKVKKEAKK